MVVFDISQTFMEVLPASEIFHHQVCNENVSKFTFALKFACFILVYLMSRSSHRRCSVKKVFLKVSQYSQENTSVGVSF